MLSVVPLYGKGLGGDVRGFSCRANGESASVSGRRIVLFGIVFALFFCKLMRLIDRGGYNADE